MKNHEKMFCFQSNSQYLTTWKWESVGEKALWCFFFAAICCCCWEMTELIWLRESFFHVPELRLKQHTNHDTNIGLYWITDVKFAVQVTVVMYKFTGVGGGGKKQKKGREDEETKGLILPQAYSSCSKQQNLPISITSGYLAKQNSPQHFLCSKVTPGWVTLCS